MSGEDNQQAKERRKKEEEEEKVFQIMTDPSIRIQINKQNISRQKELSVRAPKVDNPEVL